MLRRGFELASVFRLAFQSETLYPLSYPHPCMQLLTGGCTNTESESALQVESWEREREGEREGGRERERERERESDRQTDRQPDSQRERERERIKTK